MQIDRYGQLFDLAQRRFAAISVTERMATFVYRCPATGQNVQGFIADDPGDDATYEPVTCTACTRVHLINPKSGKVLGAGERE